MAPHGMWAFPPETASNPLAGILKKSGIEKDVKDTVRLEILRNFEHDVDGPDRSMPFLL